MKVQDLHSWNVSTAEAAEIQRHLAARVSRDSCVDTPRLIAGVDVSHVRAAGMSRAAVVIVRYPDMEDIETSTAEDSPAFPYVPGLLSFREAPLILAACERLKTTPDIILVDGQGIAHPRRFGLASHIGPLLDVPTIGCAKSLLCGACEEPGEEPGSYSYIMDNGETIGAALRTKRGTRPVFVSIGHKVDLPAAIRWVMQCCRGYRLPQPVRLAHQVAGGITLAQKFAGQAAIHA